MSPVAIVVLVLVAIALAAMLLAGLRRSKAAHVVASQGAPGDFRSHAEASRSRDGEREREAA